MQMRVGPRRGQRKAALMPSALYLGTPSSFGTLPSSKCVALAWGTRQSEVRDPN